MSAVRDGPVVSTAYPAPVVRADSQLAASSNVPTNRSLGTICTSVGASIATSRSDGSCSSVSTEPVSATASRPVATPTASPPQQSESSDATARRSPSASSRAGARAAVCRPATARPSRPQRPRTRSATACQDASRCTSLSASPARTANASTRLPLIGPPHGAVGVVAATGPARPRSRGRPPRTRGRVPGPAHRAGAGRASGRSRCRRATT